LSKPNSSQGTHCIYLLCQASLYILNFYIVIVGSNIRCYQCGGIVNEGYSFPGTQEDTRSYPTFPGSS